MFLFYCFFFYQEKETKKRGESSRTVFFMQLERFVRLPAGQETFAVGEVANGCRPRSRELGERMRVGVSIDGADGIDDGQDLAKRRINQL